MGAAIGTLFIRHIVREARQMGMRYLGIRPVARNKEAIALFTKLGFINIGYADLFQELYQLSTRKWKTGITIHGYNLNY